MMPIQRDQAVAPYYEAQKRRQQFEYARMKAKREPFPRAMGKPWNDMAGELVLHVCPSVQGMLAKETRDQ